MSRGWKKSISPLAQTPCADQFSVLLPHQTVAFCRIGPPVSILSRSLASDRCPALLPIGQTRQGSPSAKVPARRATLHATESQPSQELELNLVHNSGIQAVPIRHFTQKPRPVLRGHVVVDNLETQASPALCPLRRRTSCMNGSSALRFSTSPEPAPISAPTGHLRPSGRR